MATIDKSKLFKKAPEKARKGRFINNINNLQIDKTIKKHLIKLIISLMYNTDDKKQLHDLQNETVVDFINILIVVSLKSSIFKKFTKKYPRKNRYS